MATLRLLKSQEQLKAAAEANPEFLDSTVHSIRAEYETDPALAGSAIEELLRYTSPLQFASPRVAREDVTLAGTCIPRGTLVMAGLGSANRDESHFRDPEILDIAREPNRHLALGMGAHSCLGAPLARLEGQIALTTLFRRFPNFENSLSNERNSSIVA